jgi:hypothetical protein
MRGPPHLIGGGGSHGRCTLNFCTGTSYLRDMAGALALPGTDTAQHLPGREDLLSMGTATWCGSPGLQPHRRHTLLCEFETCGTPAAKTLQGRGFKMWACLCIYVLVCMWKNVCVCVCVVTFLSLSRLPLAWGPPG